MPQRPASFHPGLGSQLKRDSELCKVVLGAAVSCAPGQAQFAHSWLTEDCRSVRSCTPGRLPLSPVIPYMLIDCRRAFPPRCFQVLPSHQLVSRSFEDIITSGSALQLHDKELLRDQSSTVYLRETRDYAVNRFLGILVSHLPISSDPSQPALSDWRHIPPSRQRRPGQVSHQLPAVEGMDGQQPGGVLHHRIQV